MPPWLNLACMRHVRARDHPQLLPGALMPIAGNVRAGRERGLACRGADCASQKSLPRRRWRRLSAPTRLCKLSRRAVRTNGAGARSGPDRFPSPRRPRQNCQVKSFSWVRREPATRLATVHNWETFRTSRAPLPSLGEREPDCAVGNASPITRFAPHSGCGQILTRFRTSSIRVWETRSGSPGSARPLQFLFQNGAAETVA